MNTYRKTAITVGILLIMCSATAIIGMSMASSMLDAPDYFSNLAANENKTILIAIIELLWAATGTGIAIGLFPIIRKHNEWLAFGSVIFRCIENVMVIIGTLCLLGLFTLSHEFPSEALGALLLGAREWAHSIITIIFFLMGAFLYYLVMFRSKLIPRWLSGWGIIGVILSLMATVIGAFNHDFLIGTVNTILNAPIGIQEMVLAVWLIVKGFNRPIERNFLKSTQ